MLILGILLMFFIASFPINGLGKGQLIINSSNNNPNGRHDCLINLTVYDIWDLLNDTSNGIQIPIDLRSEEDWNESFIDTPWPEHPRWYRSELFQDPNGLQNFLEMFDGDEIVLYDKASYRALLTGYILCNAGFNGTIDIMSGGITAWVETGLPIRNNTAPEAPIIEEINPRAKPISGPTKTFRFTTIDPDDDKIYLYINWGDGSEEGWIGHFNSSEKVIINHTYVAEGTYTVMAKAKHMFYAEGPWGTLEIPIFERKKIINSLLQFLLKILLGQQSYKYFNY